MAFYVALLFYLAPSPSPLSREAQLIASPCRSSRLSPHPVPLSLYRGVTTSGGSSFAPPLLLRRGKETERKFVAVTSTLRELFGQLGPHLLPTDWGRAGGSDA